MHPKAMRDAIAAILRWLLEIIWLACHLISSVTVDQNSAKIHIATVTARPMMTPFWADVSVWP